MHRFRYCLGIVFAAAAVTSVAWEFSASAQDASKVALPKVEVATHKPYTEKLQNGKLTFDMTPIPGGVFEMGSPDSESGRDANEGPRHAVTIKPFWMAKVEVRWDEYDWFWTKRFPGGQPPPRPDVSKRPEKLPDAITSPTPPYSDETFGHGRENNPVLGVTYHAAMEYCRWLSKETGKAYRLPTEAEWEWACRAGTSTAYSFGNDAKDLGDYAWYAENSDDQAKKTAQKKANPWGLFDMHGNVAEWCIDFYEKDFYANKKSAPFSLNPFNEPRDRRYPYIARGGSWADKADKCRSAARRHSDKSWLKRDPQNPQSIWWMTDADFVGFRIVRAVEEDERLKGIRSKITWWSEN